MYMVGHYTPSKLIVSGTGAHVGRIDAEKSFYIIKSIEFFFGDDGLPYTRNTTEGKVVGANGDGFEFTSFVELSLIDLTYSGKMEIILGTGTGKFKGCSGSCDIFDGGQDNDGTWFKMDGYLVYE